MPSFARSEAGAARPRGWVAFTRSQLAAFTATICDFGSLILLVEVFRVWYVAATAIGSFLGAVVNFFLNRHWSFKASHRKLHGQAFRYFVVSGLSLCLNTGGVYFLTDHQRFPYTVSRGVIALLVGFFFNFPMHRYFVFK